MGVMPRPRKPYVQREVTRHGKTVWYFRRGDGPRIRLHGEYESPEWLRDYERAYRDETPLPKTKAAKGTLQWLVSQYEESGRFARLSPETQKMRKRILAKVCKDAFDFNISDLTRKSILAGKVKREAKPFAALNYLKVMSQLCAFAADAGYMDENPCVGLDKTAPASEGHHTWTRDEVERFQKKFALGTKPRLALDILLYTGFRRADAVRFGRQHVKDGIVRYRASKNGVYVEFPLLPPLAASIEASKTGDLAFLVTEHGKPWVKESFGTWFGEQCAAAGVPGRAHGLRKAGATFAAENGATSMQLAAMYGWRNPRMADTYVKKANRAILAEQAANALSPHQRSSVPAPASKSRAVEG